MKKESNRDYIKEEQLRQFYVIERRSMKDIAKLLNCSLHKISYWMLKYNIPIRSRSEATYAKRNPNGNPFFFRKPKNAKEERLMGLGLGLYWGEGTKANKNSIRLGNSDPALIRKFIEFLIVICGIKKSRLHFGLQIFSDVSSSSALKYWTKELDASRLQFQKVIITPSRGAGTYRKKLPYGVLTVHFNNKKLRDTLIEELGRLAH